MGNPGSVVPIAVIGAGHWGKNHLRNFNALKNCEVRWVCDLVDANLTYVRENFPHVRVTKNVDEVLLDNDVRAVVISTQAVRHAELARAALGFGKDVLLEKPMALNESDCRELNLLAEARRAILMVGHTFLFNDAVRRMKQILDQKEIGEIYYLKAVRSHLGLIREDVNAAWDLATHDLSIFAYLLNETPTQVLAAGGCFLKQDREDVAFITLRYGKVIGNIHVSWADSNKQRTVEIVGSKGRVVFDDLNPLEPIRVFHRGIAIDQNVSNFGEFKYLLRDGDIISPNIKMSEPLRNQCTHFLESVQSRTRPLSDGRFAAGIVRTLCEIEKSLAAGRRAPEIKKGGAETGTALFNH